MPAPVPRLVIDAVWVTTRVGKPETEVPGVFLQPAERRSAGEGGFQRQVSGRTEVERPAGVMLAAARHGADAEDGFDRLAAGEFAADDQRLARDAAEGGKRQQLHVVGCRRSVH